MNESMEFLAVYDMSIFQALVLLLLFVICAISILFLYQVSNLNLQSSLKAQWMKERHMLELSNVTICHLYDSNKYSSMHVLENQTNHPILITGVQIWMPRFKKKEKVYNEFVPLRNGTKVYQLLPDNPDSVTHTNAEDHIQGQTIAPGESLTLAMIFLNSEADLEIKLRTFMEFVNHFKRLKFAITYKNLGSENIVVTAFSKPLCDYLPGSHEVVDGRYSQAAYLDKAAKINQETKITA